MSNSWPNGEGHAPVDPRDSVRTAAVLDAAGRSAHRTTEIPRDLDQQPVGATWSSRSFHQLAGESR